MRFVIVTQTFPPAIGGMQSMMGSLAALLATRYSVDVYPDHPSPHRSYRVHHFPMNKLVRAYAKRLRLKFALTQNDIVICDSWKSLRAVPSSASHVVVMAHGQEYLTRDQEKLIRIRSSMGKATHLVANSHATLSYVRDVVDLSHVKTAIIPPTYGLSAVDVSGQGLAIGDKRQLLSICRLEERKGLHLVMEILGQLSHCPDFEWNIVGSGLYDEVLRNCINHYGLFDRVRLLGCVSDSEKQALLERADLYVMPSYQKDDSLEGFGISYIEAARCGIPSIAGVVGGVRDAVIDGFTGWCVDPFDRLALEKVVREAMFDRECCLQYGFNAKSYFSDKLCSERVLEQFLSHVGVSSVQPVGISQ